VGAGLQLSVNGQPSSDHLTSSQVLDWIHWGRISATLPDRKAIAAPLISDYTVLTGAQPTASRAILHFPGATAIIPKLFPRLPKTLKLFVPGSGFQITVPADTTVKTLNLYAEVVFGQGVIACRFE